MITIRDIKQRYGMPLKTTFINDINKYISLPVIQGILRKSLDYSLSENDRDWLWNNGQHRGKYPHLNYLCTIYIHPLTIAQHCLRLDARIRRVKC